MKSLVVCFPYQAPQTGMQFIGTEDSQVIILPDGHSSSIKELEAQIKDHSADRMNITQLFEQRAAIESKALKTLLTGLLRLKDGVLPLKNNALWTACARLLDAAIVTVVLPGPAHTPPLKIVATYLPQ